MGQYRYPQQRRKPPSKGFAVAREGAQIGQRRLFLRGAQFEDLENSASAARELQPSTP
jgi:hypothetical protein